jgi:hypothetical protein
MSIVKELTANHIVELLIGDILDESEHAGGLESFGCQMTSEVGKRVDSSAPRSKPFIDTSTEALGI